MKLTKIALAMSALMATPAVFAAGHVNVWLSGASAPTISVKKSIEAMCGGVGTMTTYQSGSSVDSGDWRAYSCTMSPAAGPLLDGKLMVIYHTVEGGSFNAYAPHLSMAGSTNGNLPGKLKRVREITPGGPLPAGCVSATPATTPPNYINCLTDEMTFSPSGSSGGTVAGLHYPNGGFSDTEYLINKILLGINEGLGVIGTTAPTNVGQAFGVAVSYPLYRQLQKIDAASGLISVGCVTANSIFSTTVPNLTAACQPNMPAQRYTTVAAQGYSADGSVFSTTGNPILSGTKLTLARRAITSGTQSTSNLRFLSNPCATGDPQGALQPKRTADGTASLVVSESSSTGGVKTVLSTATNNSELALGWVSMENTPSSTEKWAFVKLDRVSPNSDTQQRAEAMDGSYTAWYELEAFTADHANRPVNADAAELIAQVALTLGNTDLKGLFATPLAFATGPTSTGFRGASSSCKPAGQ